MERCLAFPIHQDDPFRNDTAAQFVEEKSVVWLKVGGDFLPNSLEFRMTAQTMNRQVGFRVPSVAICHCAESSDIQRD
jgi:hypothetical protein